MVGEEGEEAVSLPLDLPTRDMPMLGLPMDSAFGIPVAHLGSGIDVGREEASRAPASIRGNGEKQLQSAPEGRPGKTAAGANTKDFSDPAVKVPSAFFFFFLIQLLG